MGIDRNTGGNSPIFSRPIGGRPLWSARSVSHASCASPYASPVSAPKNAQGPKYFRMHATFIARLRPFWGNSLGSAKAPSWSFPNDWYPLRDLVPGRTLKGDHDRTEQTNRACRPYRFRGVRPMMSGKRMSLASAATPRSWSKSLLLRSLGSSRRSDVGW
jgi:hypothetical protein